MWKGVAIICGVTLFAMSLPVGAAITPPEVSKVTISVGSDSMSEAREERVVKPCVPPLENRKSDLCAQWKAADAARDSATWALGGFIVSVLTLVAVCIGFWQARSVQKQEFRAYIRGEEFNEQGKVGSGAMTIGVRLHNYGRTPARRVSTVTQSIISSPQIGWDGRKAPKKEKSAVEAIIHSSDQITIFIEHALLPGQLPMLLNGSLQMRIRYAVFYEDVFGNAQEYHANLLIKRIAGKFTLVLAENGNSST